MQQSFFRVLMQNCIVLNKKILIVQIEINDLYLIFIFKKYLVQIFMCSRHFSLFLNKLVLKLSSIPVELRV